jgi:hypothetical protein
MENLHVIEERYYRLNTEGSPDLASALFQAYDFGEHHIEAWEFIQASPEKNTYAIKFEAIDSDNIIRHMLFRVEFFGQDGKTTWVEQI